MNLNSSIILAVVVVVVILLIWSCHSKSDHYAPPLGASMYSLADNAYARTQLPDYSEHIKYQLNPQEHYSNDYPAYTKGVPGYPIACSPGDFFNEYSGKCEPRYQGSSSAWSIKHQPQPEHPRVSISGSTTPGYGVGKSDPYVVPTDVTIY